MTDETKDSKKPVKSDAKRAPAKKATAKPVLEHKSSKLTELKKVMDEKQAPVKAKTPAGPPEKQKQNIRPEGPQIDAMGRSYATGRRKESVARVWIKKGPGKILINGKEYTQYFGRLTLQQMVTQPFLVANREKQFDVDVNVSGGGLSGQAGAVRHGISRALINYSPELRKALKVVGLLTRDSRTVERKKYGLRKARRSPQFSKR